MTNGKWAAESEIHIFGISDEMNQITEPPIHSHKRNSYLKELLLEFDI
jgi:exodeoxyribonuclease V alpha subunit